MGKKKIKNRSEILELWVIKKKKKKIRGIEKGIVIEIIYFIFVLISFIAHYSLFVKYNGLKNGFIPYKNSVVCEEDSCGCGIALNKMHEF